MDAIFNSIFLNENVWTLIKISLKFVPKGLINNIPALVQIMAWRHPGDKPLSEPMMVSLLTHICITRPKWVNGMYSVNFTHGNQLKWYSIHNSIIFIQLEMLSESPYVNINLIFLKNIHNGRPIVNIRQPIHGPWGPNLIVVLGIVIENEE